MLTKKSKKNPILMEARKVLLNHVKINANDRFVTVDEFRFQMWGAADGEASLRFWGVAHREHIYESKMDHKKVIYRAQKRMSSLGRGIDFKSDMDVAGCIVRTYIFYPVVLAFYETENGILELAAYTPRWITAGLAMSVVIRKFEKSMEDLAERSETDRNGLSDKLGAFIKDKKAKYKSKHEEKQKEKNEKKKAKIAKKNDEKLLKEEIERAKRKAAGLEVEDSEDDYIEEVLNMNWSSDEDEMEEMGNEK